MTGAPAPDDPALPASERVVEDPVTGVRLSLPPGWVRLDLATSPLALAWPYDTVAGSVVRPNLVVSVESAPEQTDGQDPLEQVSDAVLHTLPFAIPGMHLASFDLVTLPGGPEYAARRLICVYRQDGEVVRLEQWWTVFSGLVTTVSFTAGLMATTDLAVYRDYALSGFAPARRPFPAAAGPRPVGALVHLDPAAAGTEYRLVDLSWIARAQAPDRQGPLLPPLSWGLLVGAREKPLSARRRRRLDADLREGAEQLIDAGLLTPEGALTDAGQPIAETLARPVSTFRLEAGTDAAPRSMRAAVGGGRAVVLALASPLDDATAHPDLAALDLVEPAWLPAVFAQWMGAAPTWSRALDLDPFPRSAFLARVQDPATPPPGPGADLSRLWSQHWSVTRIAAHPTGEGLWTLHAGPCGYWHPVALDDDRIELQPAPAAILWERLVGMTRRALTPATADHDTAG